MTSPCFVELRRKGLVSEPFLEDGEGGTRRAFMISWPSITRLACQQFSMQDIGFDRVRPHEAQLLDTRQGLHSQPCA